MSQTFARVQDLVSRGEIRVSLHGLEELQSDSVRVRDVIAGVKNGEVVDDYPEYGKGPCVLVLQRDSDGEPIHIVWGIPHGASGPAVIVTGYRPTGDRWSDDFLRRRP
ncbi:MAG: DUF4258 domain-containing protein [Candidatus Latescibacteria bacterium]|jgi:hypothetical protein|nr:DUF4258 domain-containing protein [Candidatus Latescibacterota bacterium]